MSRDLQKRQDQDVQLKAGAAVDVDAEHNPEASRKASNAGLRREEQVHGIAAAGVQGGGSKLPHYDKIQAAFGSHDISHIQAYTGSQAEGASRAMGAEAYATGNQVAFAGTPDLHTAAHEAAHVVQQQQGVQLKGGVGASGDAYEQNADAIADRVVQGKSAEDLLGAPSAAKGEGAAVQRKETKKDAATLHSELPGKSYGSAEHTVMYLAQQFHAWVPQLRQLQSPAPKTEAGDEPAVQGIENIFNTALNDAHLVRNLIASTPVKSMLGAQVKQAIGAFYVFAGPMQQALQWIQSHGRPDTKMNVGTIKTVIDSFEDAIGATSLGEDRRDPKGDVNALGKQMMNDQFDALEAAVNSVAAGNESDVPAVDMHAQFLQGVASEHASDMKAHKKKLKELVSKISKTRKEHPNLDKSLQGAYNILVQL